MDDGLVIRPSAAGSVVVSGGRDAHGGHPHAMIPFLRFGTYVTNMNTLRHPFLEEFRMAVFCRRLMPRCTWVKSGKGDESWSLFFYYMVFGTAKEPNMPHRTRDPAAVFVHLAISGVLKPRKTRQWTPNGFATVCPIHAMVRRSMRPGGMLR